MDKEINYDILQNLKSADKVRAFDLIVEACRKNDDSLSVNDTQDILRWCSYWFGND